MWQYPYGHITILVINITLGVWAFDELPCIAIMAFHDSVQSALSPHALDIEIRPKS